MTLREYFLNNLRFMESVTSGEYAMNANRAVDQAYGYMLGLYQGRSDQFTDDLADIWTNWRCHMLFGKDYTLPEK